MILGQGLSFSHDDGHNLGDTHFRALRVEDFAQDSRGGRLDFGCDLFGLDLQQRLSFIYPVPFGFKPVENGYFFNNLTQGRNDDFHSHDEFS
jgi:hypothetical protein